MNKRIIGLALLSLAACKSKDDGNAKGGSATPSKSGAPTTGKPSAEAPPSASCPADTTKNEGGFCIKLPAGWKEDAKHVMGSTTMYAYSSPDRNQGVSLKVEKYSEGQFDFWKKWQKEATAAQTVVEESDLPGGGHWILADQDGDRTSTSIVHGPGYMIECTSRVGVPFADKPENKAALEVCKNVTGL